MAASRSTPVRGSRRPPGVLVNISDKSQNQPSIAMAELAGDVTFLEDEIHRSGSITIKQPDVWGDADLMGYIQEYEQVMINRLGDFKDTIQGYLARSDQADLQSMTAMGLNLGPSTGALPTPFSSFTSNNSANTAVSPAPLSTTSTSQAPQGQVFDVLNQALSNSNASPSAKFSLEPTESLRQNSTYLKVNQGLRRINSGADSAQAAGYGLYLLRVPVSILPGRRTRQGYSGVVTMRAQMVIDPDHLRVTFPKLVFGDLADQLLRIFEDHWRDDNLPNDTSNANCTPTSKMRPPRLNGMMRSSSLTLSNPVTTQQFDNLYGYDQMNCLFQTVKGNLAQTKATAANPPRDELRKWLVSYFSGMYDQLKERQLLSGHPYHFIPQISMMYARGDKAALAQMRAGWERMAGPGTELASAGWMLIAQAAVLDRQLKDSIKDVKLSGHLAFGCDDPTVDRAEFANPCPPPETQTQELWSAFIQAQYPIHIFELDPDIEEQNIYDAFSQRRELQLAIAFAVANGNLRADQAIKYTRQMALDMATIDLNRTQVGFVHENDTFGWYFYPRVQAIDPEHSTFASCFKTLFCGGFTRDDELRQRRLEPGIRECEVLVVMPNFVPELKLDITTNWEKLTRPGESKLDYNEMIDLGAQVECVKHRATERPRCALLPARRLRTPREPHRPARKNAPAADLQRDRAVPVRPARLAALRQGGRLAQPRNHRLLRPLVDPPRLVHRRPVLSGRPSFPSDAHQRDHRRHRGALDLPGAASRHRAVVRPGRPTGRPDRLDESSRQVVRCDNFHRRNDERLRERQVSGKFRFERRQRRPAAPAVAARAVPAPEPVRQTRSSRSTAHRPMHRSSSRLERAPQAVRVPPADPAANRPVPGPRAEARAAPAKAAVPRAAERPAPAVDLSGGNGGGGSSGGGSSGSGSGSGGSGA